MAKTHVAMGMSVVAIACGLYKAVTGDVGAATACLGAGILMLIIANANDFEFFKGFGFEARTKKLDDKIREADQLVERLRKATKILSDVSFHLMARLGRFAGPIPKRDLVGISDRLAALMKELGEDSEAINASMEPVHRMHLMDLATPIHRALHEAVRLDNERINSEMSARANAVRAEGGDLSKDMAHIQLQAKWQANQDFVSRMDSAYHETDHFDLGDFFEERLAELPNLDEQAISTLRKELARRFAEFRHYANKREFKHKDEWLNRDYGW